MTQYWPRYAYYQASDYYHQDVYGRLERMRKALSELQLRAGHEEMQRANSVGALEKPDEEEEKVTKREQELKMQLEKLQEEMEKMRMENEKLKTEISEQKQDTSELEKRHQDDLSLPSDPSFDSNSPPNSPDKHVDESHSLRKRLKDAEDRAYQAENRSDELNLLLNHKLIEINKLQLTLSNQTKDLIQLEKAYYQLRCHLHRNRKMTSPTVRRITSKLNKTT